MRILNDAGYTISEMLTVLLLLSSILLITLPAFNQSLTIKDADYFFEQLERDLYEAQMTAISNGQMVGFLFYADADYYSIRSGINTLKIRHFPEGLTVQGGSLGYNDVLFLPAGTMSKSGTLYFYYGKDKYILVFQLIRGRFYIEKL